VRWDPSRHALTSPRSGVTRRGGQLSTLHLNLRRFCHQNCMSTSMRSAKSAYVDLKGLSGCQDTAAPWGKQKPLILGCPSERPQQLARRAREPRRDHGTIYDGRAPPAALRRRRRGLGPRGGCVMVGASGGRRGMDWGGGFACASRGAGRGLSRTTTRTHNAAMQQTYHQGGCSCIRVVFVRGGVIVLQTVV
jgi:hypothetical protein